MAIHQLHVLIFIPELCAWVLDANNGDPCTTPNKENATCIPLNDCKVIVDALDTYNPSAETFAQESQCGAEEDVPLVCCGSVGFPKSNRRGLFTLTPKITTPKPRFKVSLARISDSAICGMETLNERISGGEVTEPEDFPWMVALEMVSMRSNKSVGIKCGGSLISHKYILTAAHCIDHVEFEIRTAWLGAYNVAKEDNCYGKRCGREIQKIPVAEAISHNLFNRSTFYNDIGLLKLENRVEFTDFIKPICLPAFEFDGSEDGVRLTVSGWGLTENHTASDVKLKVEVPKTSDEKCTELLKLYRKEFTVTQLCAGGEPGKDSCQGDSGGPLMRRFYTKKNEIHWYQEGLVSYGVGCAEDHPAVYTRINKYAPWIEQIIADKEPPLSEQLEDGDAFGSGGRFGGGGGFGGGGRSRGGISQAALLSLVGDG